MRDLAERCSQPRNLTVFLLPAVEDGLAEVGERLAHQLLIGRISHHYPRVALSIPARAFDAYPRFLLGNARIGSYILLENRSQRS